VNGLDFNLCSVRHERADDESRTIAERVHA
jgi:hypothetical protein